ncbi:unnamed protein product [Vicia faba]|uniref:Uncharacterized protein n=1 Tax=Vicia faba TaxID=3906 RepID=A0AAV0YDI3_VICFA|nr:unnamed protein product [Vicia faba]
MLSGVKFIPRDQVQDEGRNKSDSRRKEDESPRNSSSYRKSLIHSRTFYLPFCSLISLQWLLTHSLCGYIRVVGERWGSLGELTASVASEAAAPARAHLRAIKSRQRRVAEENSPDSQKHIQRDSKRDRHHEMKAPKVQDSLSWRKRKSQFVVAEGAEIVAAAVSSLNKFANDGSFMRELVSKVSDTSDVSTPNEGNGNAVAVQNKMSANQLAAKAMQLL